MKTTNLDAIRQREIGQLQQPAPRAKRIKSLKEDAELSIRAANYANPNKCVADALNRIAIALTYLAERPGK